MNAARRNKGGQEVVVALEGSPRNRRAVVLSDESIVFLQEVLADRIHQSKQQLTRTDELPASAARQWCELVRGELHKAKVALTELAGCRS